MNFTSNSTLKPAFSLYEIKHAQKDVVINTDFHMNNANKSVESKLIFKIRIFQNDCLNDLTFLL